MPHRNPITQLATHEVLNQPPELEGYNLYATDAALKEGVMREGAGWAEKRLQKLGAEAGSEEMLRLAREANENPPKLHLFDRFGRRIDEVGFHPAYHELMRRVATYELPSIAWTRKGKGGHVAHTALSFLFYQAEAGVICPAAMCYASIPALRHQPEVAAEWEPRILSTKYDPRALPPAEKLGVTVGMAMTEKQGGSDVRANTTRAAPLGKGGPGGEYELTGHKWFCSAPMSDAFLTLAQTEGGLSCFLVPRWRPDGERNAIQLQRLKDKMGNRSNASAEIEYHGAWARMIGEDGHGVRTIIEMVQHTRLDAAMAAAAIMRQATVQALHHTAHRSAFQRHLIDQPAMTNVLADMAVESEAATALVLRVARAFDEAPNDPQARALARITTAIAKYWLNKRVGVLVHEAMECLGGAGYIEDSLLPRLYREAPVNGIWEGSGNVLCLDVLRAQQREPETLEALLAEISLAQGADPRLDAAIARLEDWLSQGCDQHQARRFVEQAALALQGALLVRHAPACIAEAFCASRLAGDWGLAFGTLPPGAPHADIVARAGNWNA